MNLTLQDVVDVLKTEYMKAKANKHVMKPLSYALYQTWKFIDSIEENQWW